MAIKIKKTSDVKLNGVKCVIYGGAGTGKTRICATAPKPIIISAESGLLSLTEVDCDYIEINTLEDLDAAYNHLKNSDDYETICLDSLSEICEVVLDKIKPNHKDKRQAYGEMADAILPMLKRFRDIKGKNVIFTSKLVTKQDEESGIITQELFIPGQMLPNQVPYLVDELFCLQRDRKNLQIMQTQPDRMRFCKDRSGALEAIEKPAKDETEINMTDIINRIIKKTNKET
jgi:hypothetical protein